MAICLLPPLHIRCRQRGVPYSAEEDQHLVEYLAEVCPADVPYVSSRLAMTIYKNLVANVCEKPLYTQMTMMMTQLPI